MEKRKKRGGRVAGVPNKATRDIRALAGKYTVDVLKELARIALHGENEGARVAASKELLDRAHGKAAQAVIPQNPDGSAIESLAEPVSELARSLAFLLRKGAE